MQPRGSSQRGPGLLTTQDWKEVKENPKLFYSNVRLKCDGYEVTLVLGRIAQFENAILVYVNGEMRGKWLTEDCQERRRFMQPVKKSLYSQKQKAAMKKMSKKFRTKYDIDPDKAYTYYRPHWKSFNSLKRHLIKHNESIELVK